jgi:hypothetical protein
MFPDNTLVIIPGDHKQDAKENFKRKFDKDLSDDMIHEYSTMSADLKLRVFIFTQNLLS